MIYYGMDSVNTDETVAKEYQSAFFCNNTPILQNKKNIIDLLKVLIVFAKIFITNVGQIL